MSAERPAEAAWRDVTIAKSKHLMPPLDRQFDPEGFETTMPRVSPNGRYKRDIDHPRRRGMDCGWIDHRMAKLSAPS